MTEKEGIHNNLISLFEEWSGEKLIKFIPMPLSGSDRKYFRMLSSTKKAIGVINKDRRENDAFIGFSKHFLKEGLSVPEIYALDLEQNVYLQEDLGDTTLFLYLQSERKTEYFPEKLVDIYKDVLNQLPLFQISSSKNLDYKLCYPRSKFDAQSMMWDLNYFKYYFLKLAGIHFDEQYLEDDYIKLIEYLNSVEDDFFLYRDFQSRNIMLKEGKLFFIDYQGGRKGALQYDLASILYDAKANIPEHVREDLLSHYISKLRSIHPVDEKDFREKYYAFVLIRIMQAMGAYGFRGFYEKKAHFLASIPYALDNLGTILQKLKFPFDLNTLMPLLKEVVESKYLREIGRQALTVNISSFSYKRGIPIDESGHGGGFVFDCRALPNPGRYDEYKLLTGKDQKVIEYLQKEEEVDHFFDHIVSIAEQSVSKYIERGFLSLSVNFGCTGGQHRSVFLAESLAKHLKNKFPVKIILRHREQEMKH